MVRDGPWLLTHVCSHWRETVILLPSLWSSLIIQTELCDINDPEALLQTALKRSKRSPLSLKLWVEFVPSFLDTPMWQRIFTVLAAHSNSWKDVEFEMDSHECYNEVMGMFSDSPIPIQLPLLETLQIILGTSLDSEDNEDGSEFDEHSISTFADAPMLRSVILKPFFPINLPWSQITYLCTSELSLQQLLDTLRVAVHLETLSMSEVYIDPQGDIPVPVTNNAIETLKTCDFKYLPYLTLPSLTSLGMDGDDLVEELDHNGWHMAARDWDELPSFVSRSGCRLKSLRIVVEKATDSLLAMLRIAMTDVTDMTFVNEPDSISQASLLPVLQKDPLLLPKLEVLCLDGSESQGYCHLDEVLEFVQSCYRNGTRPLKSLYIDCEGLYPEENEICVDDKDRRFYLDQLRVFVDDGLDLVIVIDGKVVEIGESNPTEEEM
ncbi:hypothetical protein ARMSODRAFT_1086884 [Armillaria solidipes]|uniref:F-box domain-containing protein n=1 Tax=Armillaria solidipes TaxID=1076256 RepID=A0A2H3BK59_9AGAR|nr:hypothetical protein ARMSODRAFT_1086884 [Armillaria solidipes]